MNPQWQACRRLGKSLSNLLLPPTCVVCEIQLDPDQWLRICDTCQQKLAFISQTECAKCGAQIAGTSGATKQDKNIPQRVDDCQYCRQVSFPFSTVTCLGNYQGALRDLVIQMKRSERDAVTIQMGQWLGDRLIKSKFSTEIDAIVPIPMHWSRRLRRGFHVAGLLAIGVARMTHIPIRDKLIYCRRATQKQGTLTTRQRFQNVKNCFAMRHPGISRGQKLLIVDDVMTSGATAVQASKTLLQGGANEVHVAFVARGVGRHL